MREAIASSYSPGQLRFLFATVLIHMPGDSKALYDEFLPEMSWDLKLIPELAYGGWLNAVLQSIQGYLSSQGSSLTSFKLPMPTLRPSELDDELVAFYSSAVEMQEFVRKTPYQCHTFAIVWTTSVAQYDELWWFSTPLRYAEQSTHTQFCNLGLIPYLAFQTDRFCHCASAVGQFTGC